jgi:gliding motility-associated-like protein
MKNIYLSLFIVCLGFITQAQVKLYEYPSGNLNEEMISNIIEDARQNGTKEWELQRLKDNLIKRMQYEKSNAHKSARGSAPNQVMAACTNIDFENGTYSGWTLTNGNINYVTLPCNTCPSSPGGIANITSATNSGPTWNAGIDICSGQPVVAPGGGVYSLCLNDNTAGGKIQKIQQTFSVTATNNIFTFQYLAVLEDGGHAPTDQPYFSIQMLDGSSNVIPCTKDVQSAAASISGWTAAPGCFGTNYKGWKTVTIDLTTYIGQNVTIQLIVSDCNQGGHFGYAYIDASCGQINYTNTASICSGNAANLCGPAGYATYNWTGPATGSSQCLSTASTGTYTLTTTSSLGCPSPVLTYTVNSNPGATANFSVATTPCNLNVTFTDHSTSSGTISNWSWNFGDGQTATSTTAGNTQAHTYTATGTYNVVMTCTTSAGCVSTYSTAISLSGSLTASITSSTVSCNGGTNGTATVAPTGGSGTYTYNWSPSGGTNSVATGLGAGTYTVAINDGAGCTGSSTVTITQPTALSSTFSSTPSSCGQFNGSANLSVTGGTGPYTYTWSPVGGNTSSISGDTAGVYTCHVTDANGCPYSAPVNIANTSGPAVTSIASTSVTCYGGSNGSALVTATGTGLTYSWSPSGGSSSTASGLSNGTYTVTIKDATGCTTNTVVTVLQATDIVPSSSVTPSTCGSATGSATVSATGGTGAYTYTWSPAPASGTANNASSLSAGNYNCVIKDGNGCVKSVPIFITTTSGPTVTITSSSSVTCNGGNNGSATANGTGTGTLTYSWSPTGGGAATASGLSAGSYTCVVVDGLGCISTTSVAIVQPSVLSVPVITTSVSCNGGSNGAATVNTSGGTGPYTYTWAPTGGNSATMSNATIGSYTCHITDAHGCTTFTMSVITQPSALSASVTTTSVSCNGGNNGTSVVTPSGGVGPYQYSWSPSGGNNSGAISLAAGTYVTTITDANLCTYTISSTVTQPSAVTSTSGSTNITCHGSHNGSATVTPTGGTSPYTYTWSPSGGNTSTASNLAAGNFTCTIKDANGCIIKPGVTITEPAVINITSSQTSVKCFGATNGAASVNVSGGVPTYTVTWTTTPAQTGINATNLAAGSYTATVVDAMGCTKTKKVTITTPEPKDSLTMTGSLCSTDPTVLLSAPSGTGISAPYKWYTNGTVITGATVSTYSAIQADINTYEVTWWHNGCSYVTKTVFETIFADIASIPQANVFTPNADKLNDEFYPLSVAATAGSSTSSVYLQNVNNLLKTYELFVYDRWGILMYSTTDFMKPWDGKTTGGKDAPDGTYYWLVNYTSNCNANSGRQKLKGYVQLIK